MTSQHDGQLSLEQRYRRLREVGRGGFAATFEATSVSDGRRVLVKELRLERVAEWKSVELFEREAQVLARLHHPRIPPYIDHFGARTEAGYTYYLVQELVPGESLRQRLDRGWRPTEPVVRDIADQVLSILEYLHGLEPPVIHRDIKPENVMWSDDGRAFLIDFGAVVAQSVGSDEPGSTVAGTFGYMPPEQTQGRATPQSDLYALGATLLNVLTNRAIETIPRTRLRLDVKAVTRVSAHFEGCIQRLLEPSPDDRPASATAARRALATPTQRRPWIASLVALGVFAFVLAAVSSSPRNPQHNATSPNEVLVLAGQEVITTLGAIGTAQRELQHRTGRFASTEPQGAGGPTRAKWVLAPCEEGCARGGSGACARFACLRGIAPGEGTYYRYACNTGPRSSLTCAAAADLDNDGRSKMYVFVVSGVGKITAPIPDIGDPGDCKVGGPARENGIFDCAPDEL